MRIKTVLKTALSLLLLTALLSGCGGNAYSVSASGLDEEKVMIWGTQILESPKPEPSEEPVPTETPRTPAPEPETETETPAPAPLQEEPGKQETNVPDLRDQYADAAWELVNGMSTDDKIAQLFVLTPEALTNYSGTVLAAGDLTYEAFDEYPVGGVIYMGDNLQSWDQTAQMLETMQRISLERTGLPAFLCVDEEGGTVARCAQKLGTASFYNMAYYGKDNDYGTAYDIGAALGRDLHSLGFNVDFAPVADVDICSGNELGDKLLEQAMEQGADAELEEATSLTREENGLFTVHTDSGLCYHARTVILATGAKPRRTNLPREEELIGSGVGFCAVCDGAFYKGRKVAVYGGGNSALQDALFLADLCSEVTVIHRRDSFRGEAKLVEALRQHDHVHLLTGTVITGLEGEEELTGIRISRAGKEELLPLDGLFVAIGHMPDNEAYSAFLRLDEAGYAASGEDCLTETPGLFVAGDCRAKAVRQVTTAAADGAVAALAACHYIDAL